MKKLLALGVAALLLTAGAAQAHPVVSTPPPLDFVAANSTMEALTTSIGAETVAREDDAGTLEQRYVLDGRVVGWSLTRWGWHAAEPPDYAYLDGRLSGGVTDWFLAPDVQRAFAPVIEGAGCVALKKTLADLIASHKVGILCATTYSELGRVGEAVGGEAHVVSTLRFARRDEASTRSVLSVLPAHDDAAAFVGLGLPVLFDDGDTVADSQLLSQATVDLSPQKVATHSVQRTGRHGRNLSAVGGGRRGAS